MSEIEKASAEAVEAAMQGDRYAAMLAAMQAEMVQRQQPAQVVHIHQAPPDRAMQRVALGAGMGGGAIAASVYFGPLLAASLSFMAICLAVTGLVVLVTAWAIVMVTRSVKGETTGRRKGRR